MFCHKCGNQLPEDSGFCHKCGTKIVHADTTHQGADAPVPANESSPQASAMPVQTIVHENVSIDNGKDFREFLDNHVRTTTKYQSADDLLKNSKPLMFIWVCFGIAIIPGLMTFPIGLLVLTPLLGYAAFWIAGGIIRMKYRSRFNGEFTGDVNIEDLFVFLNGHLKQIHPNFHEWSYLSSTGGLLTIIENAATNAAKEVRLCAEYGPKKKRLVVLTIRQNPDDPTAIQRYFVDATKNGFNLDGRANGMLGHGTLIRTAPILQAAMEYYLKSRGES